MRRRRVNAILAGLAISPLVSCGSGSSDDTTSSTAPSPASDPSPASAPTPASAPETPPSTTKELLVAYESSRDLTTAWTDDGSIVAVGLGDYRSPDFAILYGRLSSATDKVGFTVESLTKISYYSSDNSERLDVDQTDAALTTLRFYMNDVFESGWGVYSLSGQTYAGTFASDAHPSVSDLKDVRPIDVKLPPGTATTIKVTLLERLFDQIIPSAHAQLTDPFQNLTNLAKYPRWIIGVAAFIAAVGIAYGCSKVPPLLCAAGVVAVGIGFSRLAHGDELPLRAYATAEPPAGTIPYGRVILVDDGTCPVGQIKRVTGGNNDLGIPRMRACVPRPPTIP